MGSFIKESWLMILVSVCSGLAVAGVYSMERPRIQANAEQYLTRSVLAVVPGGAKVLPANIDGIPGVYKVLDASDSFVGWALKAKGPGFQGIIDVVVGLDPKAQHITGMTVVEQSETPGLGANIAEHSWQSQFSNKSLVEPLEVVKTAPSKPHHIHAVTAATISSKAVVTIVNDTVAKVKDRLAREAGI